MMPHCAARALFFPLTLFAAGAAGAADPVAVSHARFDDFEDGTGRGVVLSSVDGLTLGPALQPLASVAAPRVWSLAATAETLWVGTGDDGRLYRLERGAAPALLLDSPEVGLQALEPVPGHGVYVGTAPDGLVYRVRPDGAATTVARTGSRYVWDLASDGRGGLLIAAGAPARVLRLQGDRADTLLDAPADGHIRCLAAAGTRWFAGTAVAPPPQGEGPAPPARHARLYEIGDGGARLVTETDYEEVTHLAALGDTLFAAVTSSPPTNQPEATPAAALLRVQPDGAVFAIWTGTGVWAGLHAADGWLTAVAREPGQVLRVRADGRACERVAQVDSLAPNATARFGGGLAIGDGVSGHLWQLAEAAGDSGRFDGPVTDLGAHARFGAIEWDADLPAGAQLRLRTRSGNGAEPDGAWSPWSEAMSTSGQAIPSPPARYLQYRVVLGAPAGRAGPRVRRVTFTAQQSNLPPRLSELATDAYRSRAAAQGQDPQPQAGNGPDGAAGLPQSKSLRLVRWQAVDANGDDLRFRVYLRGEGQRDWKLVEEDTDKTSLIWDTASMPEGLTQLRIVASDALDNPPSEALEDELVSAPFAIDNSPPVVAVETRREGRRIAVQVTASDRVTAVCGARYTVDYADEGQRLAAADGLFDGRTEAATFFLDDLPPGEHVLSVQVWDTLDNVGVARVIVAVD